MVNGVDKAGGPYNGGTPHKGGSMCNSKNGIGKREGEDTKTARRAIKIGK